MRLMQASLKEPFWRELESGHQTSEHYTSAEHRTTRAEACGVNVLHQKTLQIIPSLRFAKLK